MPTARPDSALSPHLSELATLLERHTPTDGIHATAIPRVVLIRASRPTTPLHALHEPALCIVARGRKQVLLGDELYVYGPDQCLVASVDLPVTGQVVEASPAAPYLCFRLDLEPGQLGSLMMEAELEAAGPTDMVRGLALGPVGAPLLDATARLVRLLDTPRDIPVLAPLIIREILYRLLSGENSERLRRIAVADSRRDSVTRAIHWLKEHYAAPLRIERLARAVHMSPSALHHHFKSVTAMSPLQYQKQLRLQEARRLMLAQAMDAAMAGHSVGYESPSQFSREYSRMFGAPPSRDIARLRESLASAPAAAR
ncbi:AraC family transcriptional regulator [Corallococcus carmarthensis]|uniref:AraC family transcriptional regulator n=1 Tax=Corallococcus carmarthensis TaxID=2316728 RepID=A0A3A8K3R5_9BACT|nr:AraC family transcriptional regulator [Corallococcus carmarthensis]NOK16207.1 AraC family transcriptional regulator [Corallococcus carmarthensis]RKH01927.1 AraC family transcriptional regulator [Corallococcus carmarthensis]